MIAETDWRRRAILALAARLARLPRLTHALRRTLLALRLGRRVASRGLGTLTRARRRRLVVEAIGVRA